MYIWRWMLLSCFLFPWTAFAQQRPLRTDDAELLPTGHVRADVGVEFLQGQRFSLSGLDGDLTRLGVASIHVGLGYAEFEISGVGQDLYSVSSRTDNPPIPPNHPNSPGLPAMISATSFWARRSSLQEKRSVGPQYRSNSRSSSRMRSTTAVWGPIRQSSIQAYS